MLPRMIAVRQRWVTLNSASRFVESTTPEPPARTLFQSQPFHHLASAAAKHLKHPGGGFARHEFLYNRRFREDYGREDGVARALMRFL